MEVMTAAKSEKRRAISLQLYALIFSLFAVSFRSAEASVSQLKEANRLFKKGRYDDALKLYNDALVDTPHSSILHFNAGDAAYQSGDFSKAQKEFDEASQSAIPQLKSAAHYNRGNALFRQGHWADAIEAYKNALRINPRDENAKYNLGIALRAKQNPPQSKPQSGQGQPKDNKGGGGKGKEDEQKANTGQQQTKPGEMSREEAERLLDAARSGELKKSNQKAPKTDVPHPDEDW